MKNRANILVIDDEPDLLENIKTILVEEDYNVKTAKNGEVGLKLIENEDFDLVICDIMMPKLNGYELLDEVNNSLSKDIPFIYLSAKTESVDFRKGMSLGADDYLLKPFDTDELISTIELRLNKSNSRKQTETQTTIDEKPYSLDDQVFINVKDALLPIRISDIKYIAAKNQYSELFFTKQNPITVKKSLSHWESIFPEKDFKRVHRAYLVNVHFILKIEKWFKNQFRVHIVGVEEPISVSRRYAAKVLPNLKL